MGAMRHNIVEGEPGIFPDPIARLFVAFSRFLRRRESPKGAPAPEPHPIATPTEGGEKSEMSLTMTVEERETFLAEVHVGVLGVALPDEAPLTVPIWYSYARGGTVNVITGRSSRQGARHRASGSILALCSNRSCAVQVRVGRRARRERRTRPWSCMSVERWPTAISDRSSVRCTSSRRRPKPPRAL